MFIGPHRTLFSSSLSFGKYPLLVYCGKSATITQNINKDWKKQREKERDAVDQLVRSKHNWALESPVDSQSQSGIKPDWVSDMKSFSCILTCFTFALILSNRIWFANERRFFLLLLGRVEATWKCSRTVKWDVSRGGRERRRNEVGVSGGRKCTSIRKEQSEECFLCASPAKESCIRSTSPLLPLHSPPLQLLDVCLLDADNGHACCQDLLWCLFHVPTKSTQATTQLNSTQSELSRVWTERGRRGA